MWKDCGIGRPTCYIKLQQLVGVATTAPKYYDCTQYDCVYDGWMSIISYMQALNPGDLLWINYQNSLNGRLTQINDYQCSKKKRKKHSIHIGKISYDVNMVLKCKYGPTM